MHYSNEGSHQFYYYSICRPTLSLNRLSFGLYILLHAISVSIGYLDNWVDPITGYQGAMTSPSSEEDEGLRPALNIAVNY